MALVKVPLMREQLLFRPLWLGPTLNTVLGNVLPVLSTDMYHHDGADPLALGLTAAVIGMWCSRWPPRRSPLCLLRLFFFFVQRGKDASQGWAAVLGRQARWRRGRAGRGAGQVRVNRRQLPRVRTWHSHPERNFWKTRRRRRSFEFSSRQSLC